MRGSKHAQVLHSMVGRQHGLLRVAGHSHAMQLQSLLGQLHSTDGVATPGLRREDASPVSEVGVYGLITKAFLPSSFSEPMGALHG